MKRILPILAICLTLTGCNIFRSKSGTTTVVTPAGPATNQLYAELAEHQKQTDATLAKLADALSKSSASATAIRVINDGQPVGPRTDGVANEATLIQTVAGDATAADKAAASERARIVAEGKAADIAKAYGLAQQQATAAANELVSAKTALAAKDAALAKAQADAKAEQATLTAKLQAHEKMLADEADARVKAAQEKAAADARRLQTWIYSGGGAACIALGIFVMVFASSFPMFGPKAGLALIASGLGLIAIGQLLGELERHPWIIWAGVTVSLLGLAVAAAFIYSNHSHAQDIVKGEINPLLEDAKRRAEDLLAKAKAEADKLLHRTSTPS